MTIFVPLYFEVVLHLSASQSGLALIPLMGATVAIVDPHRPADDACRALQAHAADRACRLAILSLGPLAIWPGEMPIALVLILLMLIGAGLGTVFPISTVCMQNAVARHADGHRHRRRQFLPRAVFGAGGGGAGRDRAGRARRRHRHVGGDAGAGCLRARTAYRVPLRVHGLRAGARLRHGVPDCDGAAAAARGRRRRLRKRHSGPATPIPAE